MRLRRRRRSVQVVDAEAGFGSRAAHVGIIRLLRIDDKLATATNHPVLAALVHRGTF